MPNQKPYEFLFPIYLADLLRMAEAFHFDVKIVEIHSKSATLQFFKEGKMEAPSDDIRDYWARLNPKHQQHYHPLFNAFTFHHKDD